MAPGGDEKKDLQTSNFCGSYPGKPFIATPSCTKPQQPTMYLNNGY